VVEQLGTMLAPDRAEASGLLVVGFIVGPGHVLDEATADELSHSSLADAETSSSRKSTGSPRKV
jgi:hypothetical protein